MTVAKRKKTHTGWGGARPGSGRKREIKDRVLRSISFERAEMNALEKIAARRGVSFSEIIRTSARAYLRRQRRTS